MQVRRLTMVLAVSLVFATVALPVLPRSTCAQDRGFLVDVDALGSTPLGHIGGRRARDILDLGYGVRAEVLYQIQGRLSAGISVAALSFDMNVREGLLTERANAIVAPIYAVARLHSVRTGRFGTYAEGGIGLMSWNRDPVGVGTASSTQTAFSYDAGAGASYFLSPSWDVRAGVQYQQAVTGPGEIWGRGVDPRFLTLNLGLVFRYGGSRSGPASPERVP